MAYAVTSATFRTPRGRAVDMLYREGTSDWNTLNACMTEDEYGFKDRKITGTAVDIGAHLGGVSVGWAQDNPDAQIIAIEAVPQNAELLRSNVDRNEVSGRVTVIENAAGGSEPVEMRFGYRGSESAEHHAWIGNSSLAYDSEVIEHDTLVYEHPITLSGLVALYGPIELLKIDCEGGEYAILSDAAVNAIPSIVGEWHPVRAKTIGDVIALLPKHTVTFTGPQAGPGGFEAALR